YPGGRAKCGYSDGHSQATVGCMPGTDTGKTAASTAAEPNALGLRVVASETNTAWCQSDETLISAYCTGGGQKYPLQTYANGAKCGYSGEHSKATAVCGPKQAD